METKTDKPKRKLVLGCTQHVRLFFADRPGVEVTEADVLSNLIPKGYTAKQITGCLSYLSVSEGELMRTVTAHSTTYRLVRTPTGRARTNLQVTTPVAGTGADIGFLMTDTEVLLQVEGQTLRLTPTGFRALRAKLRSLD